MAVCSPGLRFRRFLYIEKHCPGNGSGSAWSAGLSPPFHFGQTIFQDFSGAGRIHAFLDHKGNAEIHHLRQGQVRLRKLSVLVAIRAVRLAGDAGSLLAP